MMTFKKTVGLASILLFTTGSVIAADQTPKQEKLFLTLYENNLALIEDHRQIQINPDVQDLRIEGVSPQMIPDSLILYGQDVQVHARRFDFDVTTPQKLLQKSIGQTVKFRKTNPSTGIDEIIEAKILSVQGEGIILRNGKIETGFPGTLILDKIPDDFLTKPSLDLKLSSSNSNPQSLALGYLSGGLGWNTSYVLDVDKTGTKSVLRTWANLTNSSNMDFNDAKIFLSAGKVNRRSAPKAQLMAAPAMARSMAMDVAVESVAAEAPAASSNLYVYPIKQTHDLNSGQNLQVALMDAIELKSKRELVQRFGPFYGDQRNQKSGPLFPQVELSFTNTSELPLPNGLVRVYGESATAQKLFLGEDRMGQTPKGEEVKLNTGQSFDVTLNRIQTDFQVNGLPKNTFRSSFKVTLKNAGNVTETLRLEERFPGDWKLRNSNHKPKESLARMAIWSFDLKGGETKELTFEVEVRTR